MHLGRVLARREARARRVAALFVAQVAVFLAVMLFLSWP